jgi:hypothetical protein
MMNRYERKATSFGIGAFLWLALIGFGFVINPIFGYVWTVIVVGLTVAYMLGNAKKKR